MEIGGIWRFSTGVLDLIARWDRFSAAIKSVHSLCLKNYEFTMCSANFKILSGKLARSLQVIGGIIHIENR